MIVKNGEWVLRLTKYASRHQNRLIQSGFSKQLKEIRKLMKEDPFQENSKYRYELLTRKHKGMHSRRITNHHRLVFRVLSRKDKKIQVISMWGHYPKELLDKYMR